MTPLHEHHTPNGHTTACLGVNTLDNLTYTDIRDDTMPGTTRATNDDKLAAILETQNQLLMWMKTKELAGDASNKKSPVTPILAVIIAALGISLGLISSIAITAKWTGDIEARVKVIESQHAEDKQTWEYIRTQNEVNGKALAGIQATLNQATLNSENQKQHRK